MKILYIEQNTKPNRTYGWLMEPKVREYGATLEEGLRRIKESCPGEVGAIICGTFGEGELARDGSGKILGRWRELRDLAREKNIGDFTLITALPLGRFERDMLTQEGIGLIDKGKFDEGMQLFLESRFPSTQESQR